MESSPAIDSASSSYKTYEWGGVCVTSTKYSVCRFFLPPISLLAAARDRASVNNVAIRHLKILYPNLAVIGCFSHALDHVDEKMATPNLEKFMKSWVSLFAHSVRSKQLLDSSLSPTQRPHGSPSMR